MCFFKANYYRHSLYIYIFFFSLVHVFSFQFYSFLFSFILLCQYRRKRQKKETSEDKNILVKIKQERIFVVDILDFRYRNVMSGEETSFVIDEVSNIIKETIERIIGGNSYQHNKVNRWTADIVDNVLTDLTKLGKPFKYIVQAVIMQKNGAGLHTASSCYWDNTTDGSCTVR